MFNGLNMERNVLADVFKLALSNTNMYKHIHMIIRKCC